MTFLLAPVPLLLYTFNLFNKEKVKVLPIFFTLIFYVLHLYKSAFSVKELVSLDVLSLTTIFYFLTSLFENRTFNKTVVKFMVFQAGAYGFFENYIGIAELLLFFWLVNFKLKPSSVWETLVNLLPPLLFGALNLIKSSYFNGAQYFKDLSFLTANINGIYALGFLVFLALALNLVLLLSSLKNMSTLSTLENYVTLTFSLIFLVALRVSFTDFAPYLNFVLVCLGFFTIFIKMNILPRLFLLLVIISFVIDPEEVYFLLMLPILLPVTSNKLKSFLSNSPTVKYAPVLFVAISLPLIIKADLRLDVLAAFFALYGCIFKNYVLKESLERGHFQ